MELFETIREAIRAKADTDVTALRKAVLGRNRNRSTGGLPKVTVGIPSFALDGEGQPGAHLERYTLTYPGEIVVSAAPGEQRADEQASDLARLLLVAWRSGTQLGLETSGVVRSWITGMEPRYEQSDEGPDVLMGYSVTWTVQMHETLAVGRT